MQSRAEPDICWCGEERSEPLGNDYQRCTACGTLRSHERQARLVSPESNARFYGETYWPEHVPGRGLPDLATRARNDLPERCAYWLRRMLSYVAPPATVLELGAAHGGFVHLLRRTGFAAEGLELSCDAISFAAERFGISLHTGPLESVRLDKRYDVIIATDVLEHLAAPDATLTACRHALTAEGVLFLQTPCYRGEGEGWEMLVPEEHLLLFNEAAVRQLLARSGFGVVEVTSSLFPYDMWITAAPHTLPPQRDDPLAAVAPAVIALLDACQTVDRLRDEHHAIDRDRQAKDDVITRLEKDRKAIEGDRQAKDEMIARLEGEYNAIDEDRQAKAALITGLETELAAIDRDRRAKDEIITRLEGERNAIDGDRRAKDEIITRLEGERNAIDDDRQAKDDTIERLEAELREVDRDRQAKDEVIARLEAELREVDRDRQAKDEVIASLEVEQSAIERDRHAKDDVIARLQSELAEIDAGCRAKDEVIARLEAVRSAIDTDRQAKDAVIARLDRELEAVRADQRAKEAVIRTLAEGDRAKRDGEEG